jgi:two-component SAPR family response regulator
MAGRMNMDASNIDEFEVIAKLYKDNYLEKEGFIWAYEVEKVLKDTYVILMNRMSNYYKPMETTIQLYQRLCSGSAKDISLA